MKLRVLLSIASVLLAGVGLAGEPPPGIGLQAPSAMKPGEASHLTVSLIGKKGEPVPSPQELQIEIRGAEGLGAPARVAIPAGAASVEVAVRPSKPHLWQIEASSPGLASGYALVACVAPARRVTAALPPPKPTGEVKEEKAERKLQLPNDIFRKGRRSRVEARTEAMPPPPPPPVPAATAAEASPGSDTAPTVAPSPEVSRPGHVELIAQPPKLRRGRGGWGESQLVAFWFEGDAPGPILAPLSMSLVMDGGTGDTEVNPTVLSIPTGQFQSPGAARISARRADKAVIKALYAGGQSKPVEIDFLQAEPARLSFVGASQTFRGLTSVETDLYVRLLDDDGEPATTAEPRKVNVAVQGPTGVRSYPAILPANETQVKVPVALVRPGTYSIVASAPGVQDSAPLDVRFALDWLLLASSLLGGTLGSLTRVLYRRERVWPKGLPRSLALGLAAALLVLLLSLFGVLSVLGDALPAAEALQKVSATNLAGALLLGFIAGLVFDQILGRFLGGTPGRRARPKSGMPAPKPGPA
ncbi:MAG: hypothetical protein ACJ76N_15505 [Thermoanaerobaculia bacterium]